MPHSQQLMKHLRATTKRRIASRGEFLFCKPNGGPYRSLEKPFAKACQDAGLDGTEVSRHSLRHTFASRLVMSGADPRTIQECGGWADLSLVQRYSHLSASHKTTAVERIAEEFHKAIHNTPLSSGVVHLAERRVTV
ncbi:MAG TPA: tyrosine-type recombinase/integrase [Nitrospiraceae bacterium]|nr:tyrosine-type recombinase/integrase [Nitrospiraceae bacterium]